MTVMLSSRNCASGVSIFGSSCRVIRVLVCGSGVALALALLGCAGHTESQVQYVRVEVPVQVPCRAPVVELPPWATAGLQKADSLEVKVRALLAERRQRIGLLKQMEAAIESCR